MREYLTLITPVVTDPKKAIVALKWVVREMESRYKKMSLLGVRNIENYNQRIIEAINKSEKNKINTIWYQPRNRTTNNKSN